MPTCTPARSDADGARRKRAAVQREADFYGAMDGAGKFVKGDAIAALVIVALNLAGGILVGDCLSRPAPLDALQTFALALDRQRAGDDAAGVPDLDGDGHDGDARRSDGALGADLAAQLFARPDVLRSAGGLLLALAFVPALPRPLFVALGTSAFGMAALAQRNRRRADGEAADARERVAQRDAPSRARARPGRRRRALDRNRRGPRALLAPPLADALLDRIGDVRRALAADIGIVLPGVRLRDDLSRDPRTYGIRVRDRFAGDGRLDLERLLAVADEAVLARFSAQIEREPVYQLPRRGSRPTCARAR